MGFFKRLSERIEAEAKQPACRFRIYALGGPEDGETSEWRHIEARETFDVVDRGMDWPPLISIIYRKPRYVGDVSFDVIARAGDPRYMDYRPLSGRIDGPLLIPQPQPLAKDRIVKTRRHWHTEIIDDENER